MSLKLPIMEILIWETAFLLRNYLIGRLFIFRKKFLKNNIYYKTQGKNRIKFTIISLCGEVISTLRLIIKFYLHFTLIILRKILREVT